MIHGLKPYVVLKESGVPWIGIIPKHWKLERMKFLLCERNERGFPELPLLAATQTKGVVRKEEYENRTVLALKDLHLLKHVCVGDFVISLRSFQGGIEYAREQGIISPAYTVLRAIDFTTHGFLAWLLKSRPFIENLSLYVTGIRQGQNIDYEKLSRAPLPLPPEAERKSIVRFLDFADRRIRSRIRTKHRLINLLEEQKQAIIHRVVTRGLDPKVGLKPSGIEWLDEIPEHWHVCELHRLTDPRRPIMYGIVLPGPNIDNGVPIVKGGNCEPGRLRLDLVSRTTHEIESGYIRSRLRQGDIVIAIRGGVGASEVVPPELEGANLTQDAARIAAKSGIDRSWLLYAVRSPVFQAQVEARMLGATVSGINIRDLKRIEVCVPPIAEQSAIARYLDVALIDVESATAQASREMALLREYLSMLIATVVTGKLDVRDASKGLAQEIEKQLTATGADEMADEGEEIQTSEAGVDETQEEAEA